MPPTRPIALAALAALATLAACSSTRTTAAEGVLGETGGEITHQATPRAALEANRRKWMAAQVMSYRITLRRNCFCAPAWRGPAVVVDSYRQAIRVLDPATGQPLPPDIAEHFRTISALFVLIEEALDANAAEVRVTYDATYGYPKEIYIDRDARMADEEIGYTVLAFERFDSQR